MQKKKTETQQNIVDGTVIDVSNISDGLTDRAKRFVFWYSFPGSDAFQNKKRAAIAAGYAARNASISGYKLCKNPEVAKEIERVSKSYSAETVDVLYRKYINTLETRAFYDPADYISGAAFKPIEDIAPEKRVCLEQPVIDTKGGKIVGYTFGSRRAAMAEIKELHTKEHPDEIGGYDVEETLEIIKERVSLRQQRREKNRASDAAAEAEIVERPVDGSAGS
jgi:hypothetical protein